MPETKVSKSDDEVDSEPEEDPVELVEALGRLEVVGEEEVVAEGDGEPDEVGAEEEELSGDEGDPPSRRGHRLGLRGQTGSLGAVHPGRGLEEGAVWSRAGKTAGQKLAGPCLLLGRVGGGGDYHPG